MAAKEVVSNFEKFASKLPKEIDWEKNPPRAIALKHYFARGGIVSIVNSATDWPVLVYPNKARLKQQIAELAALKKNYSEKLGEWKQKFSQAKIYHLLHNVKKLKEPLYWKHMAKYATDKDYRADVDAVKLPVHLVSDKRWKPMVQMFVNDLDYRKQLSETVENSIVYRDNKTVARFANDLRAFRMEQSSRQICELEKKIALLDADINSMHELMKWANT